MNRPLMSLAAAATLVVAACGSPAGSSTAGAGGELPEARASAALAVENGRSFNGRSFNGRSFNGGTLNGRSFNGRSFNGRSFNGVALSGVTVAAGSLAKLEVRETVLAGWLDARDARRRLPDVLGTGFVGSLFTGLLDDGSTFPLRVDAVKPLPAPNGDLLGYALSFETDGGREPMCGTEDDGSPTLAIPMAGLWNYGENVPGAGSYDPDAAGLTFACRHDAIAKCVELGYRPWVDVRGPGRPRTLAPTTVACTRMLRADYCGTGVSYTVDGTLLDVYDRYGIQVPAEPTWPVEAEWDEDGATCMTPGVTDRFELTGEIPPCVAALTASCNGSFDRKDGTLLIDRYTPAR